MGGVRKALEAQRKAEQEFVAEARNSETAPKGWPAALVMFHLSMWRERLLHSLNEVVAGRPQPPSPGDVHEINDAELASGIGTPLADAAARSDTLLGEIIDVYEKLGDRPFEWLAAKSATEAVLRNSYIHPRNHMFEYLKENGDQDGADGLFEEAETQMREAAAPPLILGTAIYNLACVRAAQGRPDDALTLLEEALTMRADLKAAANEDSQLASLRDDPRFQALVKR
jgi:hypothetical protein